MCLHFFKKEKQKMLSSWLHCACNNECLVHCQKCLMWSAAYSEQFISLQELHSQDLLLPRILAGLQQLGSQPGNYDMLFANSHSLCST